MQNEGLRKVVAVLGLFYLITLGVLLGLMFVANETTKEEKVDNGIAVSKATGKPGQ